MALVWSCGVDRNWAGRTRPASLAHREKVRTVKIHIDLKKHRYVVGESIDLDVEVINTSSSTVQVPDLSSPNNSEPRFLLRGPQYPQGVTFSRRSARLRGRAAGANEGAVELRPLAPGGTLEDGLSVEELQALRKPGQYTLTAQLDAGGFAAISETLTFTLEANAYLAASVSADAAVSTARSPQAIWLGEGGGHRRIGTASFYEKRPDLADLRRTGLRSLVDVGPDAVNPLRPWANYDRAEELGDWCAWQEGDVLRALPVGADSSQRFALGDPGWRVVPPALMTRSGNMDVFALSADGHTLRMIQFHAPVPGGQPKAPEALWSLPVDDPALEAAAALGPEKSGSHRWVVLVSQRGDDLRLEFFDCGEGAKPGARRTVELPAAHAVARSAPALSVGLDGTVSCAVVASGGSAGHDLMMLEARFAVDPTSPPIHTVTTIGRAIGKVHAAVSCYPVSPGVSPTPRWAAVFDGGAVLYGGGSAKRLTLARAAALPLQLLCSQNSTYLLTLDHESGPQFTPLP